MTVATFAELPLFTSVKPDPPRRDDGRCAYDECTQGPKDKRNKRGKLRKPGPLHRRYGSADSLLADPFCRTECCKAYHGVTFKVIYEFADETGQNRNSYTREWHEAGNKY